MSDEKEEICGAIGAFRASPFYQEITGVDPAKIRENRGDGRYVVEVAIPEGPAPFVRTTVRVFPKVK